MQIESKEIRDMLHYILKETLKLSKDPENDSLFLDEGISTLLLDFLIKF